MEERKPVPAKDIEAVLALYGFDTAFAEQEEYLHEESEDRVRVVLSVRLADGRRVVLKIMHEGGDDDAARAKTERQSVFSEFMRKNGIRTPKRYAADGRFCLAYTYRGLSCSVTAEDWCGREVQEIDPEIAYRIGELMARMHLLSLENGCEIGCGTLFSAAYWNDVDAYETFCEVCRDPRLDASAAGEIQRLREEKRNALRSVWDRLPKAAVQGDISTNNLVYEDGVLTVFDYNNAGDEVLVSDLVLEGLLTAYEMDLPAGADPNSRELLFPALLQGYLSVRRLSAAEADAAWEIYTLYHALWFSRIVHREDSLQELVRRGDYAAANRLLAQMLADLTEQDDGRFREVQPRAHTGEAYK